MAILDPRLIPLIELLAELDLDWLAFELIEGVRRGREPSETKSALAIARRLSRISDPRKFKPNPTDRIEEEQPLGVAQLVGDAQLVWAVSYVTERFEAALAEMSESLDALDEIVLSDRIGLVDATESSAVLVLLDGEEERKVDRTRVKEAQAQLPNLQQSLENWLTSTRSDNDQ